MPAYTPDEFAAVLLGAIPKVAREAAAVVRRGAQNVKNEGRRNSIVSSGMSARHAPFTIEYSEPTASGAVISSDIGYAGRGQGNLGAILEFGGGRDHSPPHRDISRALESEALRFVRAIADAGEKALQ